MSSKNHILNQIVAQIDSQIVAQVDSQNYTRVWCEIMDKTIEQITNEANEHVRCLIKNQMENIVWIQVIQRTNIPLRGHFVVTPK